MSKEAMQMALKALDLLAKWEHPASNITTKTGRIYPQRVAATAADALRQALEQPVNEPVAEVTSETGAEITMSWWHEPALPVGTLLYTRPQREWVGLTDEEIKALTSWWPSYDQMPALKVLIEDVTNSLKDKNK